jgi:hypothetical protein
MNEGVCSYTTIRNKYVMRISVFIISVPKEIDMLYAKKESNAGCWY